MKKYSNDAIPAIVNLGDNSYEFCFNFTTETIDGEGESVRTGYVSDVVTIDGKPNQEGIIAALMADGKTEIEANNLVVNLVI
jgi:hypothetical protein